MIAGALGGCREGAGQVRVRFVGGWYVCGVVGVEALATANARGTTMDPDRELDKRHPASGVLGTMGASVLFAGAIIGSVLLTGA